jgi:hypothetical protein
MEYFTDESVRTDDEFKQAADQYKEADQRLAQASADKDAAKKRLLELNGDAQKSTGFGVTVTRFTRKGSVDYKKVPELAGVDLEQYRKPESAQIKITINEG